MNILANSSRVMVANCLIEGCSVRSTMRMTGVSKKAILKLLGDLGWACAQYHDHFVRDLKVRRMQADEIWSFVGCKKKNATAEQKLEGWGDA